MEAELYESATDRPEVEWVPLPPINRALGLSVLLIATILVILGAVRLALLT
jgi:hypothetical protein